MNYRHGDIFIKRTSEGVNNKAKHNKLTVALGEATGHHHTLYPLNKDSYIIGDKNRFEVVGDVELRHQEHHDIKITPGVYDVLHETEYDYFENEIRSVVD